MLTMLRRFMPKFNEAHYAILVDWCLANVKYYQEIDMEKSIYWTKLACKYLLKRIDVAQRAYF